MVRRPKRRPKLPTSLDELIEAGGPEAFAKQEAKQAARRERQLWLGVLERLELNRLNSDQQVIMISIVESYIRELRRRLGIRPPRETVRAQTRERVRRFRARRAARRLRSSRR